jgi:multiple sugar transport system permease protein
MIIPTAWKAYPLITLSLLAAMQSIPDELYEAARSDGANRFQLFSHITWPGIRSVAMLVSLISALWIMRDVDINLATTRGGPSRSTETLALYVYNEAFQNFRIGPAAAAGTLMIVVAMMITIVSVWAIRRDKF